MFQAGLQSHTLHDSRVFHSKSYTFASDLDMDFGRKVDTVQQLEELSGGAGNCFEHWQCISRLNDVRHTEDFSSVFQIRFGSRP